MKKTLFAVVAAAAMVLSLTSCDALFAALGAGKGESTDSKAWKSQKTASVKGLDDGCQIILEDDGDFTFDTSWFTVTDTEGLCLESQPKMDRSAKTITFTKEQLQQVNSNNANPNIEAFVLYIHVNGTDKNAGDLKDNDVRGKITMYKNKTVTIKASKYAEVFAKVGLVTITNNEPVATSLYPHGNYVITEIWPLDPKTENDKEGNAIDNNKVGGEYVVEETMKFTGLKIEGQKYDADTGNYTAGGSVTFPVKAGKQIIGLYQPDRNKVAVKGQELGYGGPTADMIKNDKVYDLDGDGVKEATRADALKIDLEKNDTGEKLLEAYKKENDKLVFGYDVNVTAHATKTVHSSVFGTYWFEKDNLKMIRYKTVADTYVETYDVVYAPMEK